MSSIPPPSTATVPVSSAPSCAAPSTPRAMPETTTSPARPASRARLRANRWPAAEAMRAPTTAMARRCKRAGSPRVQITGGGGSSAAKSGGKTGSTAAIRRAPSRAPASSSLSASACEGVRGGAARPPRRARSGRASMARAAEPKRRISWAKVTGPTESVRASLSQSRRSASVKLDALIRPWRPRRSSWPRSSAPGP